MASLQEQFQNAFARNAVTTFNQEVSTYAENLTEKVTAYIEREAAKNPEERRASGEIHISDIIVTNFTAAEISELSSVVALHKACAKPENNIAVVVKIEDYPHNNKTDKLLKVCIDLNKPYTAPAPKAAPQAKTDMPFQSIH